jgi:hypothetical protein
MSITTAKGIVHSWGVGFNGWGGDMDVDLQRLSAWALAAWSNNVSTTTGLTYGYHGGPVFTSGAFSMIADGTVALTDNATNYVERTIDGTVSKNTSAFSAGSLPMAKVTTVSGAITTLQDFRGADVAPSLTTLTDAATVTWTVTGKREDMAQLTIAGARTLAITGAQTGFRGVIHITESGASRSLALPSGSIVANTGAGAIALTGVSGGKQKWTVSYDGTNYWWESGASYT